MRRLGFIMYPVVLLTIVFFSCNSAHKNREKIYKEVIKYSLSNGMDQNYLVIKIRNAVTNEVSEVACLNIGFVRSLEKLNNDDISMLIDSLANEEAFTIEAPVYSFLTKPYKNGDYNLFEKQMDSINKDCLLKLELNKVIDASKTCWDEIEKNYEDEQKTGLFKIHYFFKKGILYRQIGNKGRDKSEITRVF